MKKSYAYSLVELMIILSLFTILLFMTVPMWNTFIARNDAEAGADRIVAALQFVRVEAIKRGVDISFCRMEDEKTALSDWSQGQFAKDVSGTTIRVFDVVAKKDKLFWNGSVGADHCITFTSVGVTSGQHGDFVYCPQGRSEHALAIMIQTVGTTRIVTSMSDGSPLSCIAPL